MFELFMAWMMIKIVIAVCVIVAIVATARMRKLDKSIESELEDKRSSNHH